MSTKLQHLEVGGIHLHSAPLVNLLRMRHRETAIHSERLRLLVRDVAERLAVPEAEIHLVESAARLHDLGTIAIPDPILNKGGKLTTEERRIVESHTRLGYEALREAVEFRKIAHLVLHHHEHYDGSGYPDRLEGRNIPFGARLIAVLDAFDAMTSVRPHRQPKTRREAFEELLVGKGAQFDPEIVDAFLDAARFGVH